MKCTDFYKKQIQDEASGKNPMPYFTEQFSTTDDEGVWVCPNMHNITTYQTKEGKDGKKGYLEAIVNYCISTDTEYTSYTDTTVDCTSTSDGSTWLDNNNLALQTKIVYERFSPYLYDEYDSGDLVSSGTKSFI